MDALLPLTLSPAAWRCPQACHTPITDDRGTPSLFAARCGIMLERAHAEMRSVAMDNWQTELALAFHEETKHSYESLSRDRHFLDWANQPQPFKRYLGLEAIPLPTDLPVT